MQGDPSPFNEQGGGIGGGPSAALNTNTPTVTLNNGVTMARPDK